MVSRGQSQDSYFSRLHLVGIATLFVLVFGLGLFGWAIRPASGGFSVVPNNLALAVQKAPPGFNYWVTMSPTAGGGAVLTFEGQSQLVFEDGPTYVGPTDPFTLVVEHLGDGRICTPSTLDFGGRNQVVHAQHISKQKLPYYFKGSQPTTIVGRGFFYVRLCWPSNGPVALNGAYLSARLPNVFVFVGHSNVETFNLNLGSSNTNTAGYAIQSLPMPTIVTTGWQWAADLAPVNFAAVDTSETQHDTYDAFLSGILFGVAGGALVALIQELVAPFRTRREKHQPEPGGWTT